MAQFTNIVPTTELDAINAILQAAGQTPITQDALDTPATDDIQMAVNTVRRILADALARGWRFNTRFGMQLVPSGTYTWVDADGSSTVLNIFTKPSGVLSWVQTKTVSQECLDLVEAMSLRYTVASSPTLVLFDRTYNRDGLDASLFPYLYIDATLSVDFEKCPETFRAFVVASAANAFVADVNGEEKPTLARLEGRAYQALVREQGTAEAANLFDHDFAAQRMLGFRPQHSGYSRTLYRQ